MTSEPRALPSLRLRSLLATVGLAILAGLVIVGALALAGEDPAVRGTSSSDAFEVAVPATTDGEDEVVEVIDLRQYSFQAVLSRDPFESIRPEEPTPDPSDPADPSTPADPSQPGTPTDPSQPGTPTDPSTPGGDPSAICRVGDEAVCAGIVLTLVEADDAKALIRVGETVYEVEVGDRFAERFVVLGFGGGCVDLLYDHDGDVERFRLCPPGSTAK